MRYLVMIAACCLLCGCSWLAGVTERAADPDVQDVAVGALGKVLSGDTAGAMGQTLDLVLLLLGIKGAHLGAKAGVRRLNGKAKVQSA